MIKQELHALGQRLRNGEKLTETERAAYQQGLIDKIDAAVAGTDNESEPKCTNEKDDNEPTAISLGLI